MIITVLWVGTELVTDKFLAGERRNASEKTKHLWPGVRAVSVVRWDTVTSAPVVVNEYRLCGLFWREMFIAALEDIRVATGERFVFNQRFVFNCLVAHGLRLGLVREVAELKQRGWMCLLSWFQMRGHVQKGESVSLEDVYRVCCSEQGLVIREECVYRVHDSPGGPGTVQTGQLGPLYARPCCEYAMLLGVAQSMIQEMQSKGVYSCTETNE